MPSSFKGRADCVGPKPIFIIFTLCNVVAKLRIVPYNYLGVNNNIKGS